MITIFGLPWYVVALVLVMQASLIGFTAFMARRDVRLKTLAEADRRERLRQRLEYACGKIDGVHAAAAWLRTHGHPAPAAAMPMALLDQVTADCSH